MEALSVSRIPRLDLAEDVSRNIAEEISRDGFDRIALVIGERSFRRSGAFEALISSLNARNITCHVYEGGGEPSPRQVDSIAADLRQRKIQLVLAVGGGSIIDLGKAAAAMAQEQGSVIEYLEGVGHRQCSGRTLPLYAVPTTSGTGSEATKNAVITRSGADGFKKSLRHDNFIPQRVFIDPVLILSCPQSITAASGMDAVVQLLEAFISIRATPFTDMICAEGIRAAAIALPLCCDAGEHNLRARADMAYAAFCSGIALANAGLGLIHGLASPLGAVRAIPHGVVCGTLSAAVFKSVLDKAMAENDYVTVNKLAHAGLLLSGEDAGNAGPNAARCVAVLEEWVTRFRISGLGKYAFTREELESCAQLGGDKNSPVNFTYEEKQRILFSRL